jgi:hypothetical protein
MTWRYQTVWQGDGAERTYSLIEVYMDGGQLRLWTTIPMNAPGGNTWDELQRDIGRMYEDCWGWQPVAFAELRPGMVFRRRERPTG